MTVLAHARTKVADREQCPPALAAPADLSPQQRGEHCDDDAIGWHVVAWDEVGVVGGEMDESGSPVLQAPSAVLQVLAAGGGLLTALGERGGAEVTGGDGSSLEGGEGRGGWREGERGVELREAVVPRAVVHVAAAARSEGQPSREPCCHQQ